MRKLKLADFQQEMKDQGVEREHCACVCPACQMPQSMHDFICAGVDPEQAEKSIGFSCLGRFTGAGSPKKNSGNYCNWSLGGLLRIHELEVTTPDGEVHPFFEIASPTVAQARAALLKASPSQSSREGK